LKFFNEQEQGSIIPLKYRLVKLRILALYQRFYDVGLLERIGILSRMRYTPRMAKRANQDIKNKQSRSRKTGKRLAAKRAMLAKKGVRRGSVRFGRSGW
jgi:hypothetical protein